MNEIHMTRMQIVRGENFAEQNRDVGKAEECTGDDRHPVALEFPPHQPPLRGEKDLALGFGHPFDRQGIKGRGRHIMFKRLAGRRQRRQGCHLTLLPCSLMRGSRIASARSEINTPITVRNARNIRNDPARYMSWLLSARMSIGPVVSSDRTMAVISAPEMIAGRMDPMSEMKKLSAIRSGYLTNALNG